jgi:hypothetical protein
LIGRGAAPVIHAESEDDNLKRTSTKHKLLLMTLAALAAFLPFTVAAQKPATDSKPAPAAANAAFGKLPKIWHSDATKHDFRVEVTNDLFRAEWVNVPPAVAKQGSYIHTECRKAGSKWVGSSRVNMLFAVPGAPAGKDTKLCLVNVRIEVDSISPEKITGHSESLHAFDVNACRVQETKWSEFTWVPKK